MTNNDKIMLQHEIMFNVQDGIHEVRELIRQARAAGFTEIDTRYMFWELIGRGLLELNGERKLVFGPKVDHDTN